MKIQSKKGKFLEIKLKIMLKEKILFLNSWKDKKL